MGAAKVRQHLGEGARRCVLEREDRLLLVAHGEDRSLRGSRARAGEKFSGQSPDDLPLFRAGILSLVDQNVIDALVELVMHPGCPILAEKRESLVDQVVIVEEPAPILCRLIARDHGIGDGDEGAGAVAAGDGFAAFQERQKARLFRVQPIGELRLGHLQLRGDHPLARLELAGEKDRKIDICAVRAGGVERHGEPACLLLIVARSLREHVADRGPLR